jgi:hypothetical protein
MIHTHTHTHTHIYIYIYIYIHTHTHQFHKLQLQTGTVLCNLDFQTHFMGTIQNISHNTKNYASVQSDLASAVIFNKWGRPVIKSH